ncbi:class I SAM-dependent methyltransferase [Flavobacterium macrobrachii]|jgi:ubiquinone/menaquinone biosynthesis C-methylase UbiE|uniref:Class I SAM-dependent methyltransferase n=1 Tax=Flavobacterium macrobrachii TaxID=591204 RepID=A0ABS2CWT4_9FLAO|nr:class I SAM-dependent methyltransferase [Flavobacterium macrobrachii]MBM6499415.1 class I SAM-dependent methyltransferase [Flavobacterium macrobrachii]
MSTTKFIPALGYDFLSDYYDLAIKLTMPEKKFRNKLIDYVNPQENEKILEFGFGTAQNIIILKQRFPNCNIQGVDIDPKIKTIAEYKLNRAGIETPLFLYDGDKLPFEGNSFDKVYSSLVFHQLDMITKLKCLLEIYRILKPNGELIIGDWGKAKTKWMRFSFYLVQLLDGFKTTTDNVNGLMIKYITDAGFKNVQEVDYINTSIGTYSYYKAEKIN